MTLLIALLLLANPDGGTARVTFGAKVQRPDAGVHQHCWHKAQVQHRLPDHVDFICCHDGIHECSGLPTRNYSPNFCPPMKSKPKHGPFCGK